MDQGSTMKRSAVHNFAPTVTKFCVMWEGQALPHDTKFGNSRCEIVGRRVIFIWSLIHGLRWSGLIKAEPDYIIAVQNKTQLYSTKNMSNSPLISMQGNTLGVILCHEATTTLMLNQSLLIAWKFSHNICGHFRPIMCISNMFAIHSCILIADWSLIRMFIDK